MDLQSFAQLLSPAGQAVLAEIQACQPREADYLVHFQRFSRRFPADLTQTALEIAIQRGRAEDKFPLGGQMYFDRESLEQASSFPVAAERARRYQGFDGVLDMGCSAGGDALALAEQAPVLGIDLDPLRLALASANGFVLAPRYAANWLQADLTWLPIRLERTKSNTALFFDPARRSDGRRVYSVERYHPPLSIIREWLPHVAEIGVKLSPGVNLAELDAYDAEIEFISVQGELKEAVLWFGALRTAARRATLLTEVNGQYETASLVQNPDERLAQLPISAPLDFIYEPDPAILRAGLVALLGTQLQAAQFDADIAYLTASRVVETPFARCWAVRDWFPFQLKRLRAYLRGRGVGRVTVKKRGSPLEPEDLIRQLKLQGDAQALLFLTHLEGKPIVIVADPVPV